MNIIGPTAGWQFCQKGVVGFEDETSLDNI